MHELDRRIIGALQVDGRAPWKRIAEILDIPERTVSRRGQALIDSGVVRIKGLSNATANGKGDHYIFAATAAPAAIPLVAAALARMEEVVFVHTMFGRYDVVADIVAHPERKIDLFMNEVASISGLVTSTTMPVIRYIKTLHEWYPDFINLTEVAALHVDQPDSWSFPNTGQHRTDEVDREIIKLLEIDGRATQESIARHARVSLQTAARRIRSLRESGAVAIRAIADPGLLDLHSGAFMWIRANPRRLAELEDRLYKAPEIRYAATVIGASQIIAEVRVSDTKSLYNFITRTEWLSEVDAIETALMVRSLKQSNILV